MRHRSTTPLFLSLPAMLALTGCPKPKGDAAVAPTIADPEGKLELLLYQPGDRPAPADRCDVPLCSSLLGLIEGAQTSIDFAIYGMRNQSQVMAALAAAKARGVKVRGVVDRDREGKNYYSSTDAMVEAALTPAAVEAMGVPQHMDENIRSHTELRKRGVKALIGGDWTKLGLFLPAGVTMLVLWVSGLWMWWVPFIAKRRRARRTAGVTAPS